MRRGTSLIELLVVIVVFLIGILAVVQIFPRGLGILRQSRDATMANQLARTEMERLKGLSEQLPEAIVANNDSNTATGFFADIDVNATLNDGVPTGTTALQQDGTLVSGFGTGPWQYFTSANRFRGIIGEGRVIPAPRFIPQSSGALYGSLMILNFAPISVPTVAANALQVYGNNLATRETDNILRERFRDYVCLFDDENNLIYLPQGPYRAPSFNRSFRISLTYFVNNGGNQEARSSVFTVNNIASATAPNSRFYTQVSLASLIPGYVRADWDSLRVARLFQSVATFTDAVANPSLLDDAVYEYIPLNYGLGQLLFNPSGFEYKEMRGRGRLPLAARVDYNALDWRIIRDDFRVPANSPYLIKLSLNALKVQGNQDADGKTYNGIQLTSGGRDVVVMDMETGALYEPNSYNVDKSNGIVRMIDVDNNAANGLSADVIFPGQATAVRADDIKGRPIRVLYRAKGEWAVQPIKGATTYLSAWGPRITWDQCFPGLADGLSGQAFRIYFPLSDVGKRVTIGEIYFRDGVNPAVQVIRDQEFIIGPPATGDLRLGTIDIRPSAGSGAVLDFSYGFAVRRVRGSSVSVRVTYNPQFMTLKADPTQNLSELEVWLRGQRRSETETFLTKTGVDQ